jgi:hypothetical protein
MSRRHVSEIKRSKTDDLGVAILACENSQKSKSYVPKYLLSTIDGQSLIEHQSSIIKKVYSNNCIYVVAGYGCDKVVGLLPKCMRIVENQNFQTSGPAEYLRLLINNSSESGILFIDGNLMFPEDVLLDFDFASSFLVCVEEECNQQDIGVTISNGCVNQLSFGLKTKTYNIFFLRDFELRLAEKICRNRDKNKLLLFEILNYVINNGGIIKQHKPKAKHSIKKIETAKDLYEDNDI